jgi:hypothetical protein
LTCALRKLCEQIYIEQGNLTLGEIFLIFTDNVT